MHDIPVTDRSGRRIESWPECHNFVRPISCERTNISEATGEVSVSNGVQLDRDIQERPTLMIEEHAVPGAPAEAFVTPGGSVLKMWLRCGSFEENWCPVCTP